MGFNKRYVSKETILQTVENKDSLVRLFSSDAIILMDNFSSKIYDLMNKKGLKESEVVKLIKDGKRKGKKD